MKYFASYAQVFGNKDEVKRESLRLQTYNMLIHFLTRKHIPDNPICVEFDQMKAYFESKEFTTVYFLAPFILNENEFAKDIMNVITSSGETNSYMKVMNQVKEEVNVIRVGCNYQNSKLIKVANADEFLEKYMADPHSIDTFSLPDHYEQQVVDKNAIDGFNRGDPVLSVLYLKIKLHKAQDSQNIKEIIGQGEQLYKAQPDNSDLLTTMAAAYENQHYQEKDKYVKIVSWYQKAAMLNDPQALYMLGLYFFMGLGITKDKTKALDYFQKAAQLGIQDASSAIGIYYLSSGDKKKAKPFLLDSAAKGDYKAMLLLDTDFDRQ
jgi:tetratricopeptide (TPR) repeat protein